MPGIQPQIVSIDTKTIEPHPLSNTAIGGKIMQKPTLKQPTPTLLLSWILEFGFWIVEFLVDKGDVALPVLAYFGPLTIPINGHIMNP